MGRPAKIYLAFPIKGERQSDPLYGAIARYLSSKGELVSNHKNGYESYADEGVPSSAQSIYEDDIQRLRSADLLVAEVSTPSLGVGYEIAKAEELDKATICLQVEGNYQNSAMISGNKNLMLIRYNTIADLETKLGPLLDSLQFN